MDGFCVAMSGIQPRLSIAGAASASSSRRRNYLLHPHRTDGFIDFIKGLISHSFVLDSMDVTADATWQHIEELVDDHRKMTAKLDAGVPAAGSALLQAVPTISRFFTPLPLREAWAQYDAKYNLSKRRWIQPSFNEIRHILNLAQVKAIRKTQLKLVSFDGDCTLYSDGKDFSDPKLARYITLLLKRGVHVALVTAAGYAYDAARYAKRLSGLFAFIEEQQLAPEAAARFWVLGGECNFLMALEAYTEDTEEEEAGAGAEGAAAAAAVPAPVPAPAAPYKYRLASRESLWTPIWSPDETQCQRMLDIAEASLRATCDELQLRGTVLRKARACGLIPGGKAGKAKQPGGSGKSSLPREALDEACFRLQAELGAHCDAANAEAAASGGAAVPPFCAFNGGSDVWADIGNKKVGVAGLFELLELPPESVIHVGDQFLNTGNGATLPPPRRAPRPSHPSPSDSPPHPDATSPTHVLTPVLRRTHDARRADFQARLCCPCLWIISPHETKKVLKIALSEVLGLTKEELKEGKEARLSNDGALG